MTGYEWVFWLGFGLVVGFACGYILRDFEQYVKEEFRIPSGLIPSFSKEGYSPYKHRNNYYI